MMAVTDGLKHTSTLDFNKDKSKLIWSYVLRVIGAAVFTALFYLLTRLIYPGLPTGIDNYIGISIESLPGFVSIILVILDVILVLYLHEMVHAAVFYFSIGAPPKIGIAGFIIYAAAPGYLNKRNMMILNALAPFTVISLLGFALIALIPTGYLAWVFIPTVVNAAAAGGDFMTVGWLLGLPEHAVIEDTGDVLKGYVE